MDVEELFRSLAVSVALLAEMFAAAFIAIGLIDAVLRLVRPARAGSRFLSARKEVWVRFGVWLLLALEFELAADVVRTSLAPGWNQIGQLGSIAVIRTFLNYFLEKDIEKYGEASNHAGEPAAPKRVLRARNGSDSCSAGTQKHDLQDRWKSRIGQLCKPEIYGLALLNIFHYTRRPKVTTV